MLDPTVPNRPFHPSRPSIAIVLIALVLAALVYWPGLHGGYVFDDFSSIVDNRAVHIEHADPASLARAAMASPASEFGRPLASLSFGLNHLATGLDPFWMKATNLAIHLANGLLAFLMLRLVLRMALAPGWRRGDMDAATIEHADRMAALVAAAWLLLPINLTAVLYVVQRMESIAQCVVLASLCCYFHGRQLMRDGSSRRGLAWVVGSLAIGVAIGVLAKETAVLLPVYAFVAECIVLRFRGVGERPDRRLLAAYVVLLVLPAIAAVALVTPSLLDGSAYAPRDFTLGQRLLTEARAMMAYVRWTLLPDPVSMGLYHDDFGLSRGLLSPATTLASLLGLVALVAAMVRFRVRRPLIALGIGWFLAAHLLTSTIIPLELVYEHRNYFASIGLLLVVADMLLRPAAAGNARVVARAVGVALLLVFAMVTLLRSSLWSDPLRLAIGEADHHPASPRANYDAGRLLVIASNYDPASRAYPLAGKYLQRASALPGASTLSEQALIMLSDCAGRPVDPALWTHLEAKLRSRPLTQEDGSSLYSLTQCRVVGKCRFDPARLQSAFDAAFSQPVVDARVWAAYAGFARDLLHDQVRTEQALRKAIERQPHEMQYLVNLTELLALQGRADEASAGIDVLRRRNPFGQMDAEIARLSELTERFGTTAPASR